MIYAVGAQMSTWRLGFGKVPKRWHNGMVHPKWTSTFQLGLIFWLWVSIIWVVMFTRYHGQMNCVAMGLFEDLNMASILDYKGTGMNIAQMDLAPKDEM